MDRDRTPDGQIVGQTWMERDDRPLVLDTKHGEFVDIDITSATMDALQDTSRSVINCNRCMKAITYGEWQSHEEWHRGRAEHKIYCKAQYGQCISICDCWCHDAK